tara:strand:- start:494 stop:1018 length:525 start_codon:yes stop_codon:yes gene_type:complete
MNIKDTVYDIARNDHDVENSDLQSLNGIEEFVICRSVADFGNYKTRTIREFADHKIALDVEDKGAIKMQGKVFNFSKGYKTKVQNLDNLIQWMTERNLPQEVVTDIKAIIGENFVPKLRGLDAVATRRGMNPETARDTFLVKEWDEAPKLSVIDPDGKYAPKWAKELDDGQRRS